MPSTFHCLIALTFLLVSCIVVSGEKAAPTYQAGEAVPVAPVNEADWVDARWNQTDVGPFLSSGLAVPGGHIHKGISIRLGDHDEAAVCFDSKNLGVRAVWTGGFLKFDGTRFGLVHWPKPAGPFMTTVAADAPCWGDAKTRYLGFFVNAKRVVLSYEVDDMLVEEMPWIEKDGETVAVTRSLEMSNRTERDEKCVLGELAGALGSLTDLDGVKLALLEKGDTVVAFALNALQQAVLSVDKTRVSLNVAKHDAAMLAKVFMWSGKKAGLTAFAALVKRSARPENLSKYANPEPARWWPVVTKGKVSTEKTAYVVDTLTVPYDNPYKAMMFFSGLDFFKNGDAAICTLHGDVWRVSNIDSTLEQVKWQRYATGLFQPLGLKIIENRVYVLGRDQITVLFDNNHDGEADYYANFNNDMKTSQGGHDYSACLETDRAGNFYHVDPYGVHRISKDGKTYETLAAGWRNPISLAVGPNDEISVSPQEGTWTPSSEICTVKVDGWYGFGGPKKTDARPLGYEPPLCWIPHKIDNSTGGHVWVNSDKWGPFNGKMLNLSFGQAIVQEVMREKIGDVEQAAIATFPLRFLAGSMRGRFSPKDGQLYVVGTKGWQTVAPNDGAFQRVRYTGAPTLMPLDLHVHANGIHVTFAEALNREDAEDADNYSVERWNYKYAAQYGSDDWSVESPDKKGRDEMKVKSARLSSDGRTVFLEIADLKPVMQMGIKYKLHSASGEKVRGDIYHTVNALGGAFQQP